jgi:4-hydroxy-2-oxoheptanedioate aldolase
MAVALPGFADRLRAGETVFNVTSLVPNPVLIETLARAGYPSVTLDIQHGFYDYDSVLMGVAAAASADASTLVRVAFDDLSTAPRCLDAGAAGLLIPMVNTAEEARRVVAATKYPPIGQRSWGPNRALALSRLSPQDYLAQANRLSFVFVMIETETALSNIDAIAATEGIDGLFVGPFDLGVSLTAGRVLDPTQDLVDKAMDRVAAACERHGKTAGAHAGTDQQARSYLAKGYRFLSLGLDINFVKAGAEAALARVTRPA